jgi:hypothetical protein
MNELKFIHISKCAGTFIEEMGKLNNIKWGKYHTEYGWWHEIFINKSYRLKRKYHWFTIVRNPYTRILSEYYCEWGGINHESCKNIKIENKKQFNDFLIKKIKNRDLNGDHYTEQYKYIDKKYTIHIIKLENLVNELRELFNKYYINIDIEKYKKMNTKENKNDTIPFTINDFNNELIDLINKVYKKDFELFGYEMKKV